MSKGQNSSRFGELMVGLFMVAVIAGLAFFTIAVSGVDWIRGTKNTLRVAEFSDIGGLKERDGVVFRGMTVGSVSRLEISGDKVRATLKLPTGLKLHEGYRAEVMSSSLLGGNAVILTDGTGPEIAADAVLAGEPAHAWMRELQETISGLKQTLHSDGLTSVVTNFAEVAVSLRKITERIEKGEGALGRLTTPESEVLVNDLEKGLASFRSLSEKLDSGSNSVARLLNDDGSVYQHLNGAMASIDVAATNIAQVASRIEKGEGVLGKLTSGDDSVYNDLSATLASLKVVASRLEKGEGTLGKLTTDDKLYVDIQGLIQDVRQMLDNYRDSTPITTFASLIGGAL